MSIREMRERIVAFVDQECGKGATTEAIATAERLLGVTLSDSCRRFLSDFG